MAAHFIFRQACSVIARTRHWPNINVQNRLLHYHAPSTVQPNTISVSHVRLDPNSNRLSIRWEGKTQHNQYPLVWLRDNCQCPLCFDSSSQSRTINLADFNIEHKLRAVDHSNQHITVTWEDKHKSIFDLKWLWQRSFDKEDQKSWINANQPPYRTWGADHFQEVPILDFNDVMKDDDSLLQWLLHLEVLGICLLGQVPEKLGQVGVLANRVGFIRKTHYGEEFSVQAKADAANVAYTSGYLQLHTDLPYYDYKPGVNLLHCYIQYTGDGGDSIVADGFHVAEELRKSDPEAFKILADTEVSWLDIGQENGSQFHKVNNAPVICETKSGNFKRINFSQPQRDSHMAVSIDHVESWYSAIKKFYNLALAPQNLVQFKLQPGQMVTFNNLRVLHGRTGFNTKVGGERLVQGAYLDWDEIRSKIRVLKAKLNKTDS